jgi:hypothetical protein
LRDEQEATGWGHKDTEEAAEQGLCSQPSPGETPCRCVQRAVRWQPPESPPANLRTCPGPQKLTAHRTNESHRVRRLPGGPQKETADVRSQNIRTKSSRKLRANGD